ncbi:hypothetical protein BC938DRAFT_476658 [Jimgerdemannia flammicorona]|uniref:Uncharacterized protein n=1 Tax=Jimgerdemannia flammicorona TaxID=994334 RepID=A0A433PFC9_9FUNG|nr:hypothetical protein BC938DRAFT_476658 [Jimgerdemannia flammicorona]
MRFAHFSNFVEAHGSSSNTMTHNTYPFPSQVPTPIFLTGARLSSLIRHRHRRRRRSRGSHGVRFYAIFGAGQNDAERQRHRLCGYVASARPGALRFRGQYSALQSLSDGRSGDGGIVFKYRYYVIPMNSFGPLCICTAQPRILHIWTQHANFVYTSFNLNSSKHAVDWNWKTGAAYMLMAEVTNEQASLPRTIRIIGEVWLNSFRVPQQILRLTEHTSQKADCLRFNGTRWRIKLLGSLHDSIHAPLDILLLCATPYLWSLAARPAALRAARYEQFALSVLGKNPMNVIVHGRRAVELTAEPASRWDQRRAICSLPIRQSMC